MKIKRAYCIDSWLAYNKIIIIIGPRQVGKTTLLNDYLSTTSLKYKFVNGDDIITGSRLGSSNADDIIEFISGYELLVIDEAQKIPNIGTGLKILADFRPELKIIVTGSSSFELTGQVGEPLIGRKLTLNMYSVAQSELLKMYNKAELKQQLNDYLVFGSYPEVLTAHSKSMKMRLLNELTSSYLLKDILEFERVKSSKLLLDLLRLLAYQIGSEVSLSELGKQLGIDNKTVARYIDLFEKSFIIFSLRGFNTNLRSQITKKSKYYFYDNGVRNSLISNFNELSLRNDQGLLWENFIFMERLKKRTYDDIYANTFFWRNRNNKEIDLIEEREGKLFAYEFKWGKKELTPPKEWTAYYPDSEFMVVHPENYLEFVG
jgi:uncharacterized protein